MATQSFFYSAHLLIQWDVCLPEEDGAEKLKERIKQNRRSKLFNDASGYICLAILAIGVVLWYSQILSREIFILMSIVFISGYVLFSIRSWKNNRAKKALIQELTTVATKSAVCPTCKKEITAGNFEFCPFCGNPLKK